MEVKNGDTVLEFDGERIGFGTSQDAYELMADDVPIRTVNARPRWHEVEIYKLVDGKYVVHKIGRSSYEGETDRHSAHICNDANGAVQALYSYDRKGIWKMTIVAEDAAEQAAAEDDLFRAAYRRQRITA